MTINEIAKLLTEIISEYSRTNLCANTGEDFFVYDENSDGIIEKIELKYRYSADDIEKLENETNQHINEIISLTNGYSNEEKIKIVYDYFIDNFVYDDTYENYDIYSLFTKNAGTCCSLALGFREVLNELDIPCEVVVNKDMSHEWNKVYINNEWLNLDITKGLYLNSTKIVNARYRCYLVNDLTFLNWGYDF